MPSPQPSPTGRGRKERLTFYPPIRRRRKERLTLYPPTQRGGKRGLLFIAQQNGFQRDFDHVVEGGLTLSSRSLLMRADVVRYGTDGQRFCTKLSRNTVDASRFHFHAQDAVLFHHVEHFAAVRGVEQVS